MSYDNTTVVSTDWLGSRFAHHHIRVLDGSWYLPASGRNAREVSALGIGNDDQVVVYGRQRPV